VVNPRRHFHSHFNFESCRTRVSSFSRSFSPFLITILNLSFSLTFSLPPFPFFSIRVSQLLLFSRYYSLSNERNPPLAARMKTSKTVRFYFLLSEFFLIFACTTVFRLPLLFRELYVGAHSPWCLTDGRTSSALSLSLRLSLCRHHQYEASSCYVQLSNKRESVIRTVVIQACPFVTLWTTTFSLEADPWRSGRDR